MSDVYPPDEKVLEQLESLTADDYKRAFQALRDKMSESDWRLLEAHYRAPGHVVTATELANKVGFAGYQAVNLRYGLLAKKFLDFFGLSLVKYVNVNALVSLEKDKGTREWKWTLRPQVVEALSKLGFG